jgi:hypothetical protein
LAVSSPAPSATASCALCEREGPRVGLQRGARVGVHSRAVALCARALPLYAQTAANKSVPAPCPPTHREKDDNYCARSTTLPQDVFRRSPPQDGARAKAAGLQGGRHVEHGAICRDRRCEIRYAKRCGCMLELALVLGEGGSEVVLLRQQHRCGDGDGDRRHGSHRTVHVPSPPCGPSVVRGRGGRGANEERNQRGVLCRSADKSASFAIAALAAHKTPTPPPAFSAGNTLHPGPASAPTHAASPLRSTSLNQTRNKLKLAAKLGAVSKEEAEKAKARAKVTLKREECEKRTRRACGV